MGAVGGGRGTSEEGERGEGVRLGCGVLLGQVLVGHADDLNRVRVVVRVRGAGFGYRVGVRDRDR